MKIPKIETPTFEITLPLSKQKVSFRPFLVKEQKIILMAMESEDENFLTSNMKKIIQNCCYTKINVEDLSIVDLEYFFIHLRAKSVGEVVETKYKCNNKIEDEICGAINDVTYDILNFEVLNTEYNDLIQLTDKVGLKLRYPTYDILQKNYESPKDEFIFILLKNCIEYIYDENEIYKTKDITDDELNEFIDSLGINHLKLLQNFFDNLPSINKSIQFTCHKCKFIHTIVPRGIGSFLV